MKAKIFLQCMIPAIIFSCNKNTFDPQFSSIPNGDFEQWDNVSNLLKWQTNSCPVCVPPYEPYVVRKTTEAYHGQFAAEFIYNGVYRSYAKNKFAISVHPSTLNAYVKSNITNGDTVSIHIDLFLGTNVVDSGNWYETNTSGIYKKLGISISQTNPKADSVLITIMGGKKQNTTLFVDDLAF